MQVPRGVVVNPTTAHILSHLKDETQTKEMIMGLVDIAASNIKLLEIVRRAALAYAANLNDCQAMHKLYEAVRAVSPTADSVTATVAETVVLHSIHHMHGDSLVAHGAFLDAHIEGMAQQIKVAQDIRAIAAEHLESKSGVDALVSLLMRILEGGDGQ